MTLLIASSVLGVAIAHGLFYVALQRIGVAISSLVLMSAPVITVLGSAVVLGERFTLGQWIGGLLLIAGASLALWSQRHDAPPHPADPHELGNE